MKVCPIPSIYQILKTYIKHFKPTQNSIPNFINHHNLQYGPWLWLAAIVDAVLRTITGPRPEPHNSCHQPLP